MGVMPDPPPGQKGPPFGSGPFAGRPPGQNGGGPPPPPPGFRPPPPPAGFSRPQISSTKIIDLLPKPQQDEKSCRKKLTSYSCYTIRKVPPSNAKDKPTWAKAEVVEEKLQSGEIQSQIKRLNEAREKLISVAEKKAALGPFQQGQINRLLDELANKESDFNFTHTLAQLDKREKDLKNGKRETTIMTVYTSRAPLEHLSAIELNRNIKANAARMAEDRKRAEEERARPPQGGQGQGQGQRQGHGPPPVVDNGHGGPSFFSVSKGDKGNKEKSRRVSRYSSKRSPRRYQDESSTEFSFDSDTENEADLSSKSRSRGHGRRRPSFNRRSRSHHREYQKLYIADRSHSPPRRFAEVFDDNPAPIGARPYAPEVPRPVPSGVDPVAAAYQAGKIDADAEKFSLTERERYSYGPRERVYVDGRYPSPPSPRYERYEERHYPAERWVDEREFRPRADYTRRQREAEEHIERPYAERRATEPKVVPILSNPHPLPPLKPARIEEHSHAKGIESNKGDQYLNEVPGTKKCATPLCFKAQLGRNSVGESNYCDLHTCIAKDCLEDISCSRHSGPKQSNHSAYVNEKSILASPTSPSAPDESFSKSRTIPIFNKERFLSGDSTAVHPTGVPQLEIQATKQTPDSCPRRPRNLNSSKNIMATSNSTYEKLIKNGRKVLRVILKGVEHLACPDSGSDKNIVSKEFAKEQNFRIRSGKKDKKRFELGSGDFIESIGRARLPCSLAKGSGSYRKQWFHVLADSIVPLIMGRHFLEETQVLTKNQHLLERCPPELGLISSLKFIGSPRKRSGIGVSINGRVLVATPDTGSDLNLISLACAERERFCIDKGQEGHVRLQNADGSETKTLGRVYVASISLDLRMSQTISERQQPNYDIEEGHVGDIPDAPSDHGEPVDAVGEVFYVVKGLACDIILGDDFLDRTDAFNIGTEMFTNIPAGEQNVFGLEIFKFLGPLQSRFSKAKIKSPNITLVEIAQREHDDKYRKERFRRLKARRRIEELVESEQTDAWALELGVIEAFNQQHVGCPHCLSTRP